VTIDFHCPQCGKFLQTLEDKAGYQAPCPGCGAWITVPDPSAPEDAPPDGVANGASPPGRSCPSCASAVAADATRCSFCGESLKADREHRPSLSATQPAYLAAHHGELIVTLTVFGLFLCCFPLTAISWSLANHDLREMEAGRMDRSGYGLTRFGQIVSGLHVTIIVGGVLFFCLLAMALGG